MSRANGIKHRMGLIIYSRRRSIRIAISFDRVLRLWCPRASESIGFGDDRPFAEAHLSMSLSSRLVLSLTRTRHVTVYKHIQAPYCPF